MDLLAFINETEPEVLQKLAAEAQDEMITKVIDKLMPLFEKTAQYTAYLVLEKLAEEGSDKETSEKDPSSVNTENQNTEETTEVIKIDSTPATGNKTNEAVDPSFTPGGLKAQDVKDAISEAIEVGQSDKILPFVKAVLGKYPETFNEVIKMIKVELHDGIMKKLIDEETAISITDQLNSMTGESK